MRGQARVMLERALWGVVVVLALAVLLVWWQPGEQAAEPLASALQGPGAHRTLTIAESPAGGDFVLTGEGQSFSLADYRGQVVLLYFGYTSCPDVCPTSLALMRMALQKLEPTQLERVQGVFVSVDPERDTPERLQEYSQFFHPRILGVSGSEAQLAEAGRLYGAAWRRAESDSAMGYAVDHSSNIAVIGPDGRLVEILPHGASAERILEVVFPLIN